MPLGKAMKERYTRLAQTEQPFVKAEAQTYSGIVSDEREGRDGFRVMSDGIDPSNLHSVLWAHDDTQLPIAKHVRWQVLRDQPYKPVRAFWQFAPREVNNLAGQVQDLTDGGYLRSLSFSWRPVEAKYSQDPRRQGKLDFIRSDALEYSIVPIPALPSALIDAQARGIDTKPLAAWASRLIDTGRYPVPRPQLEAIYRAAARGPTYSVGLTSAADRVRRARALLAAGTAADDRSARARAIRERVAREDQAARARALQRPASNVVDFEARRFSIHDRAKLRQVSRRLEKGVKHHGALEDHHDALQEYSRAAHVAHRKLTSTLKELGERPSRTTPTLAALGYDHHKVTRALEEMGDALEGMRRHIGDAEGERGGAEDCLRAARADVEGVIASGGED